MNLSLQLQTDNVQVSIAKASIDAPFVLQDELQTFIEALDKNPNSMEPYVNFLKDYQIADISTAMKMLFSLSEQGSDDAQGQIHTLVERNIKMMNKAEKIRMEDQLMGVEFTMLLPMITGVVKMIADLGLLMMTLLGSSIVFLGTQEPNTLKYFSDMLGKMTVTSSSRGVSKGGKSGSNKNFQQTSREVMQADELGRMDSSLSIVFTQNHRPVQDKKYQYENHPHYEETGDYNEENNYQYNKMALFNTKRTFFF